MMALFKRFLIINQLFSNLSSTLATILPITIHKSECSPIIGIVIVTVAIITSKFVYKERADKYRQKFLRFVNGKCLNFSSAINLGAYCT